MVKLKPSFAKQSSLLVYRGVPYPPQNGMDDNMGTTAHTSCKRGVNETFTAHFPGDYCFQEVVVYNRYTNFNAVRMKGTRIYVIDTSKRTEELCGKLTVPGTVPETVDCRYKCGDIIELRVLSYSSPKCIQMREMYVFGYKVGEYNTDCGII